MLVFNGKISNETNNQIEESALTESVDLRHKLAAEIDVCDWAMLEAHYKRGDLLLVSKELNLLEAGIALALDNVEQVEQWTKENLLMRPTSNRVSSWSEKRYDKIGIFLIVRPYVLFQLQEL
jgi:hypothetical protein